MAPVLKEKVPQNGVSRMFPEKKISVIFRQKLLIEVRTIETLVQIKNLFEFFCFG